MRKLNLLILLVVLGTSAINAQKPSILVEASWLADRVEKDNLLIFHIGREEDYNKEHIPGAVFISPSEYTYDDESKNIVFDRPEDEKLKTLFESKGLSNSKEVVIYTPGGWIPLVTRLYFTLDYLGHGDKTFILDGGLAAWKSGGREVSAEKPELTKGSFKIQPNTALLADTDYVRESIDNEENIIIDCRSEVYFKGIEATHGARAGKIPGSVNIPYGSLYEASDIGAYEFKPMTEIEEIFKAKGLNKNQPIVLYCHIGMQLTVIYTTAKMLGFKDIRMYDGSFNVWGKDESLPIASE